MAVFNVSDEESLRNTIVRCGWYHKYWLKDGSGGRAKNPEFDVLSGLILDVKENQEHSIEAFRRKLDPLIHAGVAISVVPSHDPSKTESGIRALARRLAENNRVDATSCLVRWSLIEKLATGGRRDVQQHLNTIRVVDAHLVSGREVLLIDDVSTSGNSLTACEQLLRTAGATAVQKFALGVTAQS